MVTIQIECRGFIFLVMLVTDMPAAIRLTTFVVTLATMISRRATQPSPIPLTRELGSELSGLKFPVARATPIVATTPTKMNHTRDTVAPIRGAKVADLGVLV